jgi:hypothetical protein
VTSRATPRQVTVTVNPHDHHQGPLPSAFIGLFYESSELNSGVFTDAGNLPALLRNFGPGVLRFGGDSVDEGYAGQTPSMSCLGRGCEAIGVGADNGVPDPPHARHAELGSFARFLREVPGERHHVAVTGAELGFDGGSYRCRGGALRRLEQGSEEHLGEGAEVELRRGYGHHFRDLLHMAFATGYVPRVLRVRSRRQVGCDLAA